MVNAARHGAKDDLGDDHEMISWLNCVLYWLWKLGQVRLL